MKKLAAYICAFAALVCMSDCGPSKPTLRVYTWSDYIDLDLVKEFEQKFDCKVVIDCFDSNEMMYAKIKAGGSGYDIIQPTTYMVKIMAEQNMLQPMNLENIPNVKYIDKSYIDRFAYDKTLKLSIPYMIGYACIAYNKKQLGQIPDTWGVYDTDKYGKRLTLLNDMRETIGAALKYKGYSLNTRSDKELQEAKEVLLRWKKNVSRLENEAYKGGIASGEFYLVQGYKGDLFQVLEENKDLDFMLPKEGISLSCDDWVIPVGAPNKELAEKFINFMLEPANNAKNMVFTMYTAPMEEAMKYLPDELKNSDKIRLPKEIMEKSEMLEDLGDDNEKYIKIWDEIKAD